jgi:hypothetical protein
MMHNNLARKAYKLFNKKYGLSFGELSPTEVYERAAKIESRTNHHSEEGETESEWASGEQKIFCAVLPHLFFIHNINIESIVRLLLYRLKQISISSNRFLLPRVLKLSTLKSCISKVPSNPGRFGMNRTSSYCQASWKILTI